MCDSFVIAGVLTLDSEASDEALIKGVVEVKQLSWVEGGYFFFLALHALYSGLHVS